MDLSDFQRFSLMLNLKSLSPWGQKVLSSISQFLTKGVHYNCVIITLMEKQRGKHRNSLVFNEMIGQQTPGNICELLETLM